MSANIQMCCDVITRMTHIDKEMSFFFMNTGIFLVIPKIRGRT